MNTQISDEEIEGARAYNDLHVPALFQQWAPFMADAADIQPGYRVLDVACGTGVLAREIAKHVGDHGTVTGLDAAAGMLAVAEELAPSIEWRKGVAEAPPFEDGSFDAVVCQFGLMFFEDRIAAINEMLRVLKTRGRLAVAVWESLERSQAYPDAVALLDRKAGCAAADALRAPFVLGDTNDLRTLFHQAGADLISIVTRKGRARFPSIRTMVEADLRGWLPVMGVHLDETLIQSILSQAESVLSRYVAPDGTVEFDTPAHIITAVKPSS